MKDFKNQIDYLKQQVSGEKRFNPEIKDCVIRSIAPQGDILFVIARYPDTQIRKDDGTLQNVPGGLVGNEALLPEKDLTMSELLIQTDIDLNYYRGLRLDRLIGATVQVELINNRPKQILALQSFRAARAIPREIIQNARVSGQENTLFSKEAYDYLKAAGFSDGEIKAIRSEKFSDVKPEGFFLTYGDTANWFSNSTEEINADQSYKDISATINSKYVPGLPSAKARKHICFSVPTIFSGY